jgi:prolycopene isomerase
MPQHRSHYLSLSMVKALQGFGGEIRYNTEVTKFLYGAGGKCIGVIARGEVYYAKKVISNIIPNNVWNRSPEKNVPASCRKLANARKLGLSFITAYLGLDASMEELGIEDYSVFIMNDPDPRKQYDSRLDFGMYVVNCLNKVLPESSPEGTCTLFFTIPYMPGDFPETIRPQDYKKYKNEVVEKYIRHYEKTLGLSIMDHIEEFVIATPVTFARYLGTPDGEIYGYASMEWDNVVARTVVKDMENKIPNLIFCGGHSVQGDGYPSAFITGEMAAKQAIKELKEGK